MLVSVLGSLNAQLLALFFMCLLSDVYKIGSVPPGFPLKKF